MVGQAKPSAGWSNLGITLLHLGSFGQLGTGLQVVTVDRQSRPKA